MNYKFRKYFEQETTTLSVIRIIASIYDRLRGKIIAFILGWTRSYIGARTKIIGTKAIIVQSDVVIGRDSWIEAVFYYAGVSFNPIIRLGRGFSASQGLHISATSNIEIGENCLLGSRVTIIDHNHGGYFGNLHSSPNEPPLARKLCGKGSINIGRNVWIGDNVVILGSVNIGSGAVIGANSVVLKDVPNNVIVAGIPAKVIKRYDFMKSYWL